MGIDLTYNQPCLHNVSLICDEVSYTRGFKCGYKFISYRKLIFTYFFQLKFISFVIMQTRRYVLILLMILFELVFHLGFNCIFFFSRPCLQSLNMFQIPNCCRDRIFINNRCMWLHDFMCIMSLSRHWDMF